MLTRLAVRDLRALGTRAKGCAACAVPSTNAGASPPPAWYLRRSLPGVASSIESRCGLWSMSDGCSSDQAVDCDACDAPDDSRTTEPRVRRALGGGDAISRNEMVPAARKPLRCGDSDRRAAAFAPAIPKGGMLLHIARGAASQLSRGVRCAAT